MICLYECAHPRKIQNANSPISGLILSEKKTSDFKIKYIFAHIKKKIIEWSLEKKQKNECKIFESENERLKTFLSK